MSSADPGDIDYIDKQLAWNSDLMIVSITFNIKAFPPSAYHRKPTNIVKPNMYEYVLYVHTSIQSCLSEIQSQC